jgi:peptide/nickel transport system ATP-binding protein
MTPDALRVNGLEVSYRSRGRDLTALRDLTFHVAAGEAYGLVGESGCGKSTVALAIERYLPRNGRVSKGSICVGEQDVYALGDQEIRALRSTTLSMVYQDAGRALNPSLRVGEQIAEIFRLHGLPAPEARAKALTMLKRVRIPDQQSVYDRYAHQLSGGMQQRVSIAMALSIEPKLLILDEPTTGLDATVEAEILDLIARLRREITTAVLFISHNLGVISRMCDRVGVLYAGSLVEEGSTADIFHGPRHPYTVGLLRCLPRRGRRKDHGRLDSIPGSPPAPGEDLRGCLFAPRCGLAEEKCRSAAPPFVGFGDRSSGLGERSSRCHFASRAPTLARLTPDDQPAPTPADRTLPPMLEAIGLSKSFGGGRHQAVHALHAVSLQLWPGETLGLVGESGSGKSTLARVLLGLTSPELGGTIALDGTALAGDSRARRAAERKSLQIVFQNPDSALNRSHTVRRLIGRVLTRLARIPRGQRAVRLLQLTRSVRLDDHHLNLRPRELSGGLKQRAAIARAFAGEPRIVVCDEPTSALDVSVQAAILNLLVDLQVKHQVSYLFISHDLTTVRYLSDRIAVLYLGRLMEIGPAERVFSGPHHPYTAALLSAGLGLGDEPARRTRLAGEIPSAIQVPRGCVFHTRCPRKLGVICEEQEPPLLPGAEPGHQIRCHIPASKLAVQPTMQGESALQEGGDAA